MYLDLQNLQHTEWSKNHTQIWQPLFHILFEIICKLFSMLLTLLYLYFLRCKYFSCGSKQGKNTVSCKKFTVLCRQNGCVVDGRKMCYFNIVKNVKLYNFVHDCVYNSVPQITIYFFNSEDISQNEKAKAFFFLVFNDFVFLVNAPLINFSKSNKYLVTMLQLHYHDHFLAFR